MPSADKITLKEEENQGCVHYIIEKFVLWRLQSWKNNPRVNALIWKAVLSVLSLSLIGLLVALVLFEIFSLVENLSLEFDFSKCCTELSKIQLISWIKLGLAFSGSTTIAYWNMSTMFNKKWQYCADLYNSILTADVKNRETLRNALAIDLLTLDLWAHRSFSALFKDELLKAIEMAFASSYADEEKKRALDGKYSESEALELLGSRNHRIIDQA